MAEKNQNLASIGARVLGGVLDFIFVMLISFVIMFIFFRIFPIEGFFYTHAEIDSMYRARGTLIALFVDALYTIILLSGERQATWGQRIAGVKLQRVDGSGVGVAVAIGRWLMSCVSSIFLKIGYLIAIFTKNNQTLHDLVVGTVVVNVEESKFKNIVGGGNKDVFKQTNNLNKQTMEDAYSDYPQSKNNPIENFEVKPSSAVLPTDDEKLWELAIKYDDNLKADFEKLISFDGMLAKEFKQELLFKKLLPNYKVLFDIYINKAIGLKSGQNNFLKDTLINQIVIVASKQSLVASKEMLELVKLYQIEEIKDFFEKGKKLFQLLKKIEAEHNISILDALLKLPDNKIVFEYSMLFNLFERHIAKGIVYFVLKNNRVFVETDLTYKVFESKKLAEQAIVNYGDTNLWIDSGLIEEISKGGMFTTSDVHMTDMVGRYSLNPVKQALMELDKEEGKSKDI